MVLLGFGLNLGIIFETGKQSLPIIVCTIGISLLLAWALHKALRVPSDTAILVGVGSSICGGSAIAATAPVIGADDNEVAQSISVIFFFNVLAAISFPMLGSANRGRAGYRADVSAGRRRRAARYTSPKTPPQAGIIRPRRRFAVYDLLSDKISAS